MVIALRDKGSAVGGQPPIATLGADIRDLRRTRGMRLVDLANAMGRSVGWLSQVERDLSVPSATDLQDMARALDVTLATLFRSAAPPGEQGVVLRAASRRAIGSRLPGLVEESLSPDQTDLFEMIHVTIAPGARMTDPMVRATQEVGHVISGRIDLWIGGQRFEIGTGDSFRIRGEAFYWMNPYEHPCRLVWVIAPPMN